jgi:hypothetical protein
MNADPDIRRRRAILYSVAAVVLAVLVAFAILPRGKGDEKPKNTEPPRAAVILERIKLKAVDDSKSSGIAELLRRGEKRSLRVLAVKLKPNKGDDEAYQLVLTGGEAEEKLLGNAIVGTPRVFVGESKLKDGELERYRRIELRRVTRGPSPSATTVLRGKISR